MKAKNFTKEQVIGFYRKMLLIRRFEEKAGQLKRHTIVCCCFMYVCPNKLIYQLIIIMQEK